MTEEELIRIYMVVCLCIIGMCISVGISLA